MYPHAKLFICLLLVSLLVACGTTQATQPTLEITPPEPAEVDSLLVYQDIPYNSTQALDIYQPANEGPYPLVVILHGGGAHKESVSALSRAAASLGAVVFAPEYHSAPPYPPVKPILQAPEDAACAVRFARAVAVQFKANPERVLVIGHSGGGFVAADLALAGDDFHGDCLIDAGSALVDAVVGLDGAYDVINCCVDPFRLEQAPIEEWNLLSPYAYVDRKPIRKGVAFFMTYGNEPEIKEMAIDFAARLEAAGYPVTLEESPGTDHGSMSSPDAQGIMDLIRKAFALFQ